MSGQDLDAIVVPISGGGMASGIALATAAVNPSCKIILVEPEGKMLGECLKGRRLRENCPVMILMKVDFGGLCVFSIFISLCSHGTWIVS